MVHQRLRTRIAGSRLWPHSSEVGRRPMSALPFFLTRVKTGGSNGNHSRTFPQQHHPSISPIPTMSALRLRQLAASAQVRTSLLRALLIACSSSEINAATPRARAPPAWACEHCVARLASIARPLINTIYFMHLRAPVADALGYSSPEPFVRRPAPSPPPGRSPRSSRMSLFAPRRLRHFLATSTP